MGRLAELARNPKRGFRAVKNRRREAAAATVSTGWQDGPEGLKARTYASYEDYVRHQKSKLDLRQDDIARFDEEIHRGLTHRIGDVEVAGRSVLCLGARLGGEVRAFRDKAAFAIGVDLNPGAGNPWVLTGDFHELLFRDDTIDVVFTNSVDHALDVGRMASEARRVLKPGGHFIVEASDIGVGKWEAQSWDSIDSLIGAIEQSGFSLASRQAFATDPWPGEHLRFTVLLQPMP